MFSGIRKLKCIFYLIVFISLTLILNTGCSSAKKRISTIQYPDISSYNSRLPITLCFGSISDDRTKNDEEFKGWLSTQGNVPLAMNEFRLQLVKRMSYLDVFERILVLDEIDYSSFKEELNEARMKGADILARCKLASMDYTSETNFVFVVAFVGSVPFGFVCIGVSAITAVLTLFSDKDFYDTRWAFMGDLFIPSITGKVQPLLYVELYDVSTGEQIAETSTEWLITKKVNSPFLDVKSAWRAYASDLAQETYSPLSEDIALFIADIITNSNNTALDQ